MKKKILQKIRHNQSFRQTIALKSLYWFFHIYFLEFTHFPSADIHKTMLFIPHLPNFSRLILLGFPKCGKSLVYKFAYPLWSIVDKQQKKIVIVVQDKIEENALMYQLLEVLSPNSFLVKEFNLQYKKKGNKIYFPTFDASIYIRNLNQTITEFPTFKDSIDLMVIDPLVPIDSTQYEETYKKIHQWCFVEPILKQTRIVIIGRGDDEDDGVMSRLYNDFKSAKDEKYFPVIIPFLDEDNQPTWKAKFKDEHSVSKEIASIDSLNEFCAYFPLHGIPKLPLYFEAEHLTDLYPTHFNWSNEIEVDMLALIEEVFLIPYQGDDKQGSVMWAIKNKSGSIIVLKQFKEGIDFSHISELQKDIERWKNDINPDLYISLFCDSRDKYSLNVYNKNKLRTGYKTKAQTAFSSDTLKIKVQSSIFNHEIMFTESISTYLRKEFHKESTSEHASWVRRLALLLPNTSDTFTITHICK